MNAPATTPTVEPWLRGTRSETPAVVRAVLHAIDLALENIADSTTDLTIDEIDARPYGLASIGFHIRHLTGALDRSLTYASGSGLPDAQFAALAEEKAGKGVPVDVLLGALRASAARATQRLQALDPADFEATRWIGRKRLATTLGGIVVHIADHTQRHTGQVVSTAKLLKALRG
jgi:uncharacterized damage-inducible protein DinB